MGNTGNRRTPLRVGALLTALVTIAVTLTGTAGAATPDPDGWTTATPAEVGMDATLLDRACEYAFGPNRNTQGLVIVRAGRLVRECYAPGAGPRSWVASWSDAKTFASTLVGIAHDRGEIPDLDASMAEWIPSWRGTDKAVITLRDVLTMSSGLEWDETYNPAHAAESNIINMLLSGDQLAYAAAQPLTHIPGTRWKYSSGDAMLLSAVIAGATGMSAGEYARQVLFGPLGMQQVEWWDDAAGHTLTYCCLDSTSRNFARLGLLFLNNGNWNGTQVVSQDWVHDAWQVVPDSEGQYGFMWWRMELPGVEGPIWYASGFDGQWIFVIPSLDMVVVRNGTYVKSECPAVADPNLFERYPPLGLVPGRGTMPPFDWSNDDLLAPIVASVTGPAPEDTAFPAPEAPRTERFPDGQATAPCGSPAPARGPSGDVPPVTAAALPVRATPSYTG